MKLRPHHLLCTQGYSGKGYDKRFVDNMTVITNRLRKESKTKIDITFSMDSLCCKCPRNIGKNICQDDDKVLEYDKKVISYFKIEEKTYIYQELIKEINYQMSEEIMDDICSSCNWYPISNCKHNILKKKYSK